MNKIDRTGYKTGRLTVINKAYSKQGTTRIRHYWECKCECGKIVFIVADSLTKTKSCGCLHNEITALINKSHGEARKTKEYSIWASMKNRCIQKSHKQYHRYGGRGIKICERWINNYSNFLSDMGRVPNHGDGIRYSLDRINNDGNYEPSNCKWSTYKEQANNKSTK